MCTPLLLEGTQLSECAAQLSPQVAFDPRDLQQKILCDNAKQAGVTIYTIHVNTGGDPTASVLKYCASGADKFYEVKQANQTLSVFNSIGQSLAKLRIAK